MRIDQPIEVARETLKQLTARKLPPTPENFERVYNELTDNPHTREGHLVSQLIHIIEAKTTGAIHTRPTLSRLQQAAANANWEQIPQLVVDATRESLKDVELGQNWGTLIRNLIRVWDLHVPNLPRNTKQTTLERVLINYGNQPEMLNQKLSALITNWNLPASRREQTPAIDTADTPSQENTAEVSPADETAWQAILVYALEHGLAPRITNHPTLRQELDQLIAKSSPLDPALTRDDYLAQLRAFLIKLELYTQQEGRLITGLTGLLKLMLDNIAALNPSDRFLAGQIASLQTLLSQPLLSMQQLYQLENSLREVSRLQGNLKQSINDVTDSLRQLINGFISRLADITDTTASFQQNISKHSQRMKKTTDVTELGHIIAELMEDTVQMQQGLSHSHDELINAQNQVEAAEQRIQELERALDAASAKVKEDQLTGAYNRHGLAEYFQREITRAERSHSTLCIALIDVDNFKQLNDRYGHLTGDDALVYLVDSIRNNLRPADIVARFGGEEFVLLMPETHHDEALETVRRLQRELTKTFFLTHNDRLVITFSAGIAQWHQGEGDIDLIERADQAMYQAKLAGKNRVYSAEKTFDNTRA